MCVSGDKPYQLVRGLLWMARLIAFMCYLVGGAAVLLVAGSARIASVDWQKNVQKCNFVD